jgi:hypothetical protein
MTRAFVAALLLACTGATAAAEEWPLRGWGVDERLEDPSVIAAALRDASAKTGDLPLFVRLDIGVNPSAADSEKGLSAIDTRVREYEALGIPVLLVVDIGSEPAGQSDAWVRRVRAIGERFRGRVAGYQIGRTLGTDPRAYAFLLKLAAVQLRSIDTTSIVVQATGNGDLAAAQVQLHAEGTIPYVDAVAVDGARSDAASAVAVLHATLERDDPTARIIVAGIPLAGEAAESWLRTYFSYLGNTPRTTTFGGTRDQLAAAFRAASALRDVLAGETVTLDEQAAGLRLVRGANDVTSRVGHRLLYNLSNFSTYLVYWSDDDDTQPIRVELTEPSGREPMIRDALTADARAVSDFKWDPGTKRVQLTAPPAPRPLVLDFNYGAGDVYVSRSEVVQAADLKVEEIIFRYQQAQAAQDALLGTYVANVIMEQHFRATVTDSYDVVTDNRFYVSKGAVEWEELSFSVNGAKWGPDRPPFPLLQAEKVLSLPLDLRLGADYRYTLRGAETIVGRRCYIVEFEPLGATESLYRGRVWIDAERFTRLKLQAVQTRLDVPIVSNEETHTFEPVGNVQGRDVYLLTRLSSKQIVLIAGRNLLLEKEARFSDFRLNPPDFDTLRDAAHDSEHIMYRDTEAGLRYLVKQGEQRVVSEMQTTRAKAMAFGTTIDPSYAFPLPMFGINYLDFEFLGNKNSQLALLFAGVLALGNVQRPRIFDQPLNLNVDFFAIAVPTSDRIYDVSGERADERLQNIPFSTGANFGYQFTDFQKVSASYQFRYDFFFRDRDTPESFVTPSSTVTNAGGLGYEYSRGGYTLLANGTVFRRASWRPWGNPEALVTGGQTYKKYTVGGSKDVFMGPFQKLHFNAQWFGGRDLDRFSMYQFGLFDETRMHGVPASGVRFEELAMVRASYSFNVFDQYRFDLFLDRAVGRTPEAADEWLHVTGTGVALNLRAPWNTMLRVDAGKSFLPDLYRGLGSVVVQVLVLKPL